MKIEFDIKEIIRQTDEMVVGKDVGEYKSVYVASINYKGKQCALYTIVDLETEYKNLVVVDDDFKIIGEKDDNKNERHG